MRWLLLLLPIFCPAVSPPPGRPSKAPFVSGDAFRAIADYCYDEVDRSLDPASVKAGSSIFVKTDFLNDFFIEVHPRIPVSYVLISHNSDDPSPGRFAAYLDDEKVLAWFGQNYDGYPHPKMHPIPIGIANYCWEHGNAEVIADVQKQHLEKVHLAHMQFAMGTFPEERIPVSKQFAAALYCYKPPKKPFSQYLSDVASAVFEIAPRGNGADSHRIWESLYVGTIPIVKTSPLDSLYAGLPVLIVQDWSQVNERFLREKQEEFSKTAFNLEKISMDYWVRLIDACKGGDFLQKTTSVIIPCAAQHFTHLAALLNQYSHQTCLPDEVVISLSQIERLDLAEIDALEKGPWPFQCKILRHVGRRSAGANRNLAAQSASGELIISQDADDIPHPQRVEIAKYIFENHPIVHLIHSYLLRKEAIEDNPFIVHRKEEIPVYTFPSYDALDHSSLVENLHNGNICFLRSVTQSIQWEDVLECDQDVKFNRDVYKVFTNRTAAVPVKLVIYRPQFSAFTNPVP